MRHVLRRKSLAVGLGVVGIAGIGTVATIAVGNSEGQSSGPVNVPIPALPDAANAGDYRVAFPSDQNDNIVNVHAAKRDGRVSIPLAFKCDPPARAEVRMCGGAQEGGSASFYVGRASAEATSVRVLWSDGTTTVSDPKNGVFVASSAVPDESSYGPAARTFTALSASGEVVGSGVNPAADDSMPPISR